jgi:putative DNA methylase
MLILNGDSSRLPIPDASVDAVVTDPPYFDFIHYSELSDFFFAWLSLVLRDRYPWFSRKDSSNEGEVQHKDPRAFARQLSAVFTEAGRVLKDDGVLAFSFHHSRAEGWAAIYEAVNKAGMAVVAAYPVHAELLSSTPKNAAKSPISIDAILVCRKRASLAGNPSRTTVTQNTACSMIGKFNNQGPPLSDKDRFVIHASQTLIQRAQDNLSFDEIENAIENSQWQ